MNVVTDSSSFYQTDDLWKTSPPGTYLTEINEPVFDDEKTFPTRTSKLNFHARTVRKPMNLGNMQEFVLESSGIQRCLYAYSYNSTDCFSSIEVGRYDQKRGGTINPTYYYVIFAPSAF